LAFARCVEAARLVKLARKPVAQRASSKPVLPKPAPIEPPRTIQRQLPSMPRPRCLEAGDSV